MSGINCYQCVYCVFRGISWWRAQIAVHETSVNVPVRDLERIRRAGVRSKSADLSGRRRMSDFLRHCTRNVTTVYSRIPVNQNSLQTAERYPGPGVWWRVSVVSRQTDGQTRLCRLQETPQVRDVNVKKLKTHYNKNINKKYWNKLK